MLGARPARGRAEETEQQVGPREGCKEMLEREKGVLKSDLQPKGSGRSLVVHAAPIVFSWEDTRAATDVQVGTQSTLWE